MVGNWVLIIETDQSRPSARDVQRTLITFSSFSGPFTPLIDSL